MSSYVHHCDASILIEPLTCHNPVILPSVSVCSVMSIVTDDTYATFSDVVSREKENHTPHLPCWRFSS